MDMSLMNEGLIKIVDEDLEEFWNCVNACYRLGFNIEGQNLSDKVFLYE
jgi:hypothetical protein